MTPEAQEIRQRINDLASAIEQTQVSRHISKARMIVQRAHLFAVGSDVNAKHIRYCVRHLIGSLEYLPPIPTPVFIYQFAAVGCLGHAMAYAQDNNLAAASIVIDRGWHHLNQIGALT